MSALSDIVAKFRKGSPNIAAAFDEVERRLVAVEGSVDRAWTEITEHEARLDALEDTTEPPPPPPPPPPPTGTVYFYDDFETVYPVTAGQTTPAGLNPRAAPVVEGFGLFGRLSWDGNGSATSNKPLPNSTERAVHFPLGAGGGASWASRWDYRKGPGWRFYGFEWYFAPGWVGAAGACSEIRYYPWLRGGGPAGLSPHDNAMKLQVQSGYMEHPWGDYDNGGNALNAGRGENVRIKATGRGVASDWHIIPVGQMNAGVVHQVIVGVYWTLGPQHGQPGAHYLGYWRRRGEPTWNKTVDVQDAIPSEWWGKDSNGKNWQPTEMFQGNVPALYNHGIYRGAASAAVNVYLAKTVETDTLELCQARMG